jgi:hypothetical protein
MHIFKAHKITKEKYAEKHKTDEWITCTNCGREFFRRKSAQIQGKYGQYCCTACASEYTTRFVTETNRINGTYSHEEMIRKAKIGHQTLSDRGYYKSNEWHQHQLKVLATLIKHNHWQSDNFKNGRIKAIKTCKETNAYDRARETRFNNFGIYSNFFPSFSLDSQELFVEIEKQLSNTLTCYYAIKQNEFLGVVLDNGTKTSGEYQVWIRGNTLCRFLDFYIKELNICIEFDEEHHEKEKAQKYDLIRENDIRKVIPNIKIFRVKKRDYLSDKNKVLKQCLDFICQCAEHSLHFRKSIVLEAEHLAPLEVI